MKLELGSNSQAGQESFVLEVLNRKRDGFYLEIGGYHSKDLSNTYILENRYGWKGVSVEIDNVRVEEFRENRLNPMIQGDATVIDYNRVLAEVGSPLVIDYLQVDIEPARNSFRALMKALQSNYTFSIITFEHEVYASKANLFYKFLAQYFLKQKGYRCLASNVCNEGNPFEDWYVHGLFPRIIRSFPRNSEWIDLFSK